MWLYAETSTCQILLQLLLMHSHEFGSSPFGCLLSADSVVLRSCHNRQTLQAAAALPSAGVLAALR
jgi:hypothetical protein